MPGKDDKYFKIHVHSPKGEQVHHKKEEPKHEKQKVSEPKGKRSVVEVIGDGGRQIVASVVILVIGFFLLNASAYYQIAKSKFEKLTGTETESPLLELIEETPEDQSTENLQSSSDPNVQKKQIPELDMDIAPNDNRVIVPRIDQNIPIVRISSDSLIRRDWQALENEMQDALKDGVVHYPGTSLPGETGNIVITGHSSYFPWDAGRFKDVFALLEDVVEGDKVVVYHEQDKYIYEVYDIKIVLPEDIEVLKQTPEDKLTLITCWPVGTNLKRLIVTAKPVEVNGVDIESKIIR
jgi:LPXTG-site transpeptidase (sortase) family protein